MFNRLYKKCLNLAAHKNSNFFLGLVSFIESSFFPIPPDVMIIPMVIVKKKNYLKIFFIASVFSVLGGIFGYVLGAIFFDIAMNIIEFYGYENKITSLKNSLSEGEGFLAWLSILFLAGFTPIPFKVFTVSAGAFDVNFIMFIVASTLSRSARFFLVSGLIWKYGKPIHVFIDKYFNKLAILFTSLLISGFLLIKYLI